MTTPTVCSIPALPAPSISPSCQEEWKRINDCNESCVVYSLAWHEHYLVAVTSHGQVCIWNVPTLNQEEDLDQMEEMELFQKRRLALVKVQVSSGVLYSVDFHITSQHRTLLIVSGDEGILGFDWLAILDGGNNSNNTLPLFRCKPHYSLSPVEINDFDISNNFMFGAAGDANGYKWDLETNKVLATYPSAKRGYLHSIECMHNDSTVLMGGEDGVLGIWDGNHDKLIDNVDIQNVLHKEEHFVERDSAVSSSSTSLLDPSKSSMWISNIHSPLDNWWTVCGGISHSNKSSASQNHGAANGHVLSFHSPTRSLVAGRLTRETPQYSCSNTPGTLVTVANEGVVSHWTPSSLQRRGRVWCTPPSCFAAAVGGNDNVLAVAGVGKQVDIFNNVGGNKSYSLVI